MGRQSFQCSYQTLIKRVSQTLGGFWLLLGLGLCSLWLAGFLALPALSGQSQNFAQASGSLEELQQQRQQIDQDRSNISKERDRIHNMEKATQRQLANLNNNLQATDTQIKDYGYQLQLATKYLKELQEDLTTTETSYQQKRSATVSRLLFLQRQQTNQGWAVLLQSQNLNEFLDRRRQLKLVYQADQKILQELKVQADEINQQRNLIEQQKNTIALLNQQLLAQKTQLQAQAQSQQDLLKRLNTDRRALEAAEAQLARDSKNLQTLIQQRLADQRAKEAAARAMGRDLVIIQGTGQMSYPSSGPITSSFGWRVHPILGYERFHSGVDFGDDYGTTIRAADRGTVILADWYGGYGNAVLIDHGNGLTSLYAHASELFVTEGQVVQRGEAIAAVGSTGFSTGPHLHFEVHQEGEPVDPMAYL